MQTLLRPRTPDSGFKPPRPRRKRFSPYMFVGIAITLLIVAGAGIYLFTLGRTGSHAANVNMDCTLTVPPNPLSAKGLATPYKLSATDGNNGPCNEANANQTAFVQGAVFDPATGQISVYNPLVVDKGTQPAVAPVLPKLPANAVVALWFGFNGTNLTLKSSRNSLNAGNCVNGADGSIFGQVAFCNAANFFKAANGAIAARQLVPPPLGMAKDGMVCPTVRDFSVVDQDQSDNVTTKYLVDGNGITAQRNAANMANLPNDQTLSNGSDNGLIDGFIDPALGCTPWMVPDLANPGQMATAQPLDELQAAMFQANPVALVPAGDPMVLSNNNPDLNKVNAYRKGVDQMPANSTRLASTKTYCTNLLNTAPQRIFNDAQFTKGVNSPDMAAANSLFTFLANRFNTTWGNNGGLNCQGLLNKQSPIQVTTDNNGVAIDATLNGQAAGGGNNGGGNNGGNNGGGNNNGYNNGGTQGTTNNGGTQGTTNNGGTQGTTNNNGGTQGTPTTTNNGNTQGTPTTTNNGGTQGTPTNNGGTQGTTNNGGTQGTTNNGGTQGTTNNGGTQGTTNNGGTQGTTNNGGTQGTTNNNQTSTQNKNSYSNGSYSNGQHTSSQQGNTQKTGGQSSTGHPAFAQVVSSGDPVLFMQGLSLNMVQLVTQVYLPQ